MDDSLIRFLILFMREEWACILNANQLHPYVIIFGYLHCGYAQTRTLFYII